MLAIIPIFLEDEQALWSSADGKTLLLKCFSAASNANEINKLIVCTNDRFIFNLSRSHDIDSRLIDLKPKTEKSALLPLGTHAAARNVLKSIKSDVEDLMVLSFRNPTVTPDLLDEAIKTFKASKTSALISVKKSTDHPCQLVAYYKIMDIGFLHLFENEETTAPYLAIMDNHCSALNDISHWYQNNRGDLRITKPFYFDWRAEGIQDKGASGIYVRTYHDSSVQYIPVDSASRHHFHGKPHSFWISEDTTTARVLSPLQDTSPTLLGNSEEAAHLHSPHDSCNAYEAQTSTERKAAQWRRTNSHLKLVGAPLKADTQISPLLFRDTQHNRYILSFASGALSTHSWVIKLLPIPLHPPNRTEILDIELRDLAHPIPILFEDNDISGIIYCLLKASADDTYDFCEPFPPDRSQWTNSFRNINVTTQREIIGRQDFPDVFEPDGTLCIMRKGIISSLESEILQGHVYGFIMQETDSIQINSWYDMLRYAAISKMLGRHS